MDRHRLSRGLIVATVVATGAGCIGSVTDEEFERILDERRSGVTSPDDDDVDPPATGSAEP